MKIGLNNAIAAVLCFAPAILSASTGPGPQQPGPPVQFATADVKAAWATSGVRIGYNQDVLGLLVTVTDAKTGLPVLNLTHLHFHVTFATVLGIQTCPIPPAITAFDSPTPGVYRMTVGFTNVGCSGWFTGQFPVALQVMSVFNPGNPFSPGSYQGQLATLVEIH